MSKKKPSIQIPHVLFDSAGDTVAINVHIPHNRDAIESACRDDNIRAIGYLWFRHLIQWLHGGDSPNTTVL